VVGASVVGATVVGATGGGCHWRRVPLWWVPLAAGATVVGATGGLPLTHRAGVARNCSLCERRSVKGLSASALTVALVRRAGWVSRVRLVRESFLARMGREEIHGPAIGPAIGRPSD